MKKMKTALWSIICVLALALCLTACTPAAQQPEGGSYEKETVRIAALKGPTALGMLHLMEDQEKGEAPDEYEFTLAGAPDEILGSIIQGEFDIAAVPVNVASVLYNRTEGKVQIGAVNTLGVLYILEKENTVSSVSDLKGRTIVSTGQGASPEYSLGYILQENGLKVGEDVELQFLSESSEVAAQIAAGNADLVMLPQPFVTTVLMQNEGWHVALSLEEEWQKLSTDSMLVTGCVVVQKAFAEEHPEALARFMEAYEASIHKTNDDPAGAGELAEKFDVIKAAVATKAIPECNLAFVSGEEMKTGVSGYLEILFDSNPQSVGGALPADDFYYGAK